MYLDNLTMLEFEEKMKSSSIVILPIGACEEHGKHLPLNTDTVQPLYVAEKVAELTGSIIAPPIFYGYCSSTANFPGTLSISFDTLRALVGDVLSELARQKAKKVVVLSGHAGRGHMIALKLAAEEVIKANPDMTILVLSDYDIVYERMGDLEGLVPASDGHAGLIETSRVLAIRPELVKGKAEASFPDFPKYRVLADPEKHFPTGIMGDPTNASAETGSKINDIIIERLTLLFKELKNE